MPDTQTNGGMPKEAHISKALSKERIQQFLDQYPGLTIPLTHAEAIAEKGKFPVVEKHITVNRADSNLLFYRGMYIDGKRSSIGGGPENTQGTRNESVYAMHKNNRLDESTVIHWESHEDNIRKIRAIDLFWTTPPAQTAYIVLLTTYCYYGIHSGDWWKNHDHQINFDAPVK